MTKIELRQQINEAAKNIDQKIAKNVLVMSADFCLYDLNIVVNVGMKIVVITEAVDCFGSDKLRENMILEVTSISIDCGDASLYYRVTSPLNGEILALSENEFYIFRDDQKTRAVTYNEAI